MSPKQADEPVIFVKWMDFITWLLPVTGKFPKHVRFTLVDRIDNLALDITEDLVDARYSKEKWAILRGVNLNPGEEPEDMVSIRVWIESSRVISLRRQAIAMRRFLAPQREALSRLVGERAAWLDESERSRLREVADRTARYVEDLDSARDRMGAGERPSLGALSRRLAALGVTGCTDTTPTLDDDDAAFFAVNSLVEEFFVLTVEFNLHLLRPVAAGRRLERQQEVIDGIKASGIVTAVFDEFEKMQTFVAELQAADLGVSINISALADRAGIVEDGLFLGIAHEALVAGDGGVRTLVRREVGDS